MLQFPVRMNLFEAKSCSGRIFLAAKQAFLSAVDRSLARLSWKQVLGLYEGKIRQKENNYNGGKHFFSSVDHSRQKIWVWKTASWRSIFCGAAVSKQSKLGESQFFHLRRKDLLKGVTLVHEAFLRNNPAKKIAYFCQTFSLSATRQNPHWKSSKPFLPLTSLTVWKLRVASFFWWCSGLECMRIKEIG